MLRDRLKEILKEKGIKSYRLGKDLGIDHGQLSRFLNGKGTLSLKKLEKIAGYLECEVTLDKALGKEDKTKGLTPLEKERIAEDKIQKAIEQSENLCNRTVDAIYAYPGSVKIVWK